MLEKRKETYERITESVQAMIANSDPTTAASLQRQLDEVKEAWEQVSVKSEEEGHKLEDALKNAEELERQLTDMDSWLTQVHDQILSFDHVSSILDVLEKQRQEYKVARIKNGCEIKARLCTVHVLASFFFSGRKQPKMYENYFTSW